MENIISFPSSFSAWLAFLYVVTRLVHFSLRSLPGKNYPPGPRSFPFIGNVLHFKSDKPFLEFTELGKKYGDIVGLKAGPDNIVILNSVHLVRELLERRGRIYSGRPFGYIHREHIVRDSQHIIFLQNDDYLRQWRTASRYILGSNASEQVMPIQEAAAADLMMNLLENQSNFLEQFRVWALVAPMRTICGDKTARKNRELQQWFFDNQEKWMTLLTPGTTPPVDIFPIMKYVPEFISGWKRTARSVRKNQTGFYYMMLDKAKKELEENSASADPTAKTHESLMAKILREQQEGNEEYSTDQLAYLGGGLFDAAIDTTYCSSLIFIMALAAHPDTMKKAQAEVDSLHGSGHPPRSEDIGKLPYLKACYLEVRKEPLFSKHLHTLMMPLDFTMEARCPNLATPSPRLRRHSGRLSLGKGNSGSPKHVGHKP